MEHSVIDYIINNDDEMRKQAETTVEYQDILRRQDKLHEKLTNTFSDEQKDLFERFEENIIEEISEIVKSYFKMGMKLGVRLVAESMFD